MSDEKKKLPECVRLTMWAGLARGLTLSHSDVHAILYFMYRDERAMALGFVEGGDFVHREPELYVKVFDKTMKRLKKAKGDCTKIEAEFDRRDAKAKRKHDKAAAKAQAAMIDLGLKVTDRDT